jgi:hypothetical protein
MGDVAIAHNDVISVSRVADDCIAGINPLENARVQALVVGFAGMRLVRPARPIEIAVGCFHGKSP